MEQRPLRLGDILDDYCPRERRVTNHAVVAMIDDDVKQTRCTTCDAEHPYKGGKEPRKRKKDTPAALYREVLAGMDAEPAPVLTTPPPAAPETIVADSDYIAPEIPADDVEPDPLPAAVEHEGTPGASELMARDDVEEGPVHRPLIRATLPRPEGQKDARPLPEFTVRHSGNRGNGSHRGDAGHRSRGAGGNRAPGHGGHRFAGARGRGRQGGGFRPPQPSRHGGRKRSR